jgi:DNA repair protein RadC
MKDLTVRSRARGRTTTRHAAGGQFDLLRAALAVAHRGKQLDSLVAYLAQHYDSLADILSASAHQLSADPNVGSAAAEAIVSLNRTMIEAAFAPIRRRSVLDNERAVIIYLQLLFGRRREEEARILYLDGRYAVISQEVIAVGTGNAVDFRPVTVARLAVKAGAAAIIVAHNHPSGDPRPSRDDFETTREIERCCAAVNVRLINHYIISFGDWHSFRNCGAMVEPLPDITEPFCGERP